MFPQRLIVDLNTPHWTLLDVVTAAIELSIRMVESVGAKRQDVVFDMSCEKVDELFPWVNIPTGILEIEREDCYYSSMFDPILDEATAYSCNRREYVAGITRLTDTRVQVMCCRLRSRDESNCHETVFNKPIGLSKSTIVEYENQLINAIRLDGERYVVRFCDMSPRDIGSIYTDVKTTTTPQYRTTTRPTTIRPYKSVKMWLHSKKVEKLAPTNYETMAPKIKEADVAISSLPTEPSIAETSSGNKEDRATAAAPSHTSTVEYLGGDQFDGSEEMLMEESSTKPAPPAPATVLEDSNRNAEAPVVEQPWQEEPQSVVNDEKLMEMGSDEETDYDESATNSQRNQPISLILKRSDYLSSSCNSTIIAVAIASTMQSPTSEVSKSAKTTPVHTVTDQKFTEKSVGKPADEADINANNKAREDSLEDITMGLTLIFNDLLAILRIPIEFGKQHFSVSDLSRLTFHNDEFPKSNEKKLATSTRLKISKTELPLKAGVSADDFLFLRPINSEGHRRSPIRTYRPHVEIRSSEEDDGLSRTHSSWETTTVKTSRPKKEPYSAGLVFEKLKPGVKTNEHVQLANAQIGFAPLE
ncbi:hypothetical protein ANCCEY_06934 [Ancylostoma ceylanicum]|uniref:Uncharacterized protein n=1 Tax=Ancylostoma ceylanicum TaxID=53326 RepID=A0A0D6M245_9BILA|nr:hypothetical protein ANCCEY_06934 [Ancylostoma ceylanicum]